MPNCGSLIPCLPELQGGLCVVTEKALLSGNQITIYRGEIIPDVKGSVHVLF